MWFITADPGLVAISDYAFFSIINYAEFPIGMGYVNFIANKYVA